MLRNSLEKILENNYIEYKILWNIFVDGLPNKGNQISS
jgi:hypothetical protein